MAGDFMAWWKQDWTARRRLSKRARWSAALTSALLLFMMSLPLAQAAEAPAGPASAFGMTAPQNQSTREMSVVTRIVDSAWSILLFEEHRLTQNMTGAVRNIKSTTNVAAAAGGLVVASFIYGILHAVGPGHGKAVISSYMLADKETLRRGIFLAFLSSLIQALSAITLIGGLYLAARATGLQTKWAEAWLETLSWGFVALIGAWLMIKQIAPMFSRRRAHGAALPHDAHQHSHGDHVHEHAFPVHEHHNLSAAATEKTSCTCDHDHSHAEPDHEHDAHCGHAHLPGPDQLRETLSWSRALAISLSIGIRPCTGALLVIIFAAAQGLIWAGILATFAMAFGTALTVSALAALSVGSRKLAITLAGADSRWGNAIAQSSSFVASAAVFVLGTAFFFASFQPARPF